MASSLLGQHLLKNAKRGLMAADDNLKALVSRTRDTSIAVRMETISLLKQLLQACGPACGAGDSEVKVSAARIQILLAVSELLRESLLEESEREACERVFLEAWFQPVGGGVQPVGSESLDELIQVVVASAKKGEHSIAEVLRKANAATHSGGGSLSRLYVDEVFSPPFLRSNTRPFAIPARCDETH